MFIPVIIISVIIMTTFRSRIEIVIILTTPTAALITSIIIPDVIIIIEISAIPRSSLSLLFVITFLSNRPRHSSSSGSWSGGGDIRSSGSRVWVSSKEVGDLSSRFNRGRVRGRNSCRDDRDKGLGLLFLYTGYL